MPRQNCTMFSVQKDSNYLDVKLEVFKGDNTRDFHLAQNLTMGEAHFNQFMQLPNQLAIVAANLAGEENLSPMLIP